ncbi:MAG: hypothetical protein IJ507_00855 [Clostridia bacterium]|nr:hypothetical protein [Clostridia bacterium]
MMRMTSQVSELFVLLCTPEFSPDRLQTTLASGKYSADDISEAACRYVHECRDEELPADRSPGETVEGVCSAHMPQSLEILLAYGLDPNRIWREDTAEINILEELMHIPNGYVAADSLALLLRHGGNPDLIVDGESLLHNCSFDLLFDLVNQEDRIRYDALVHYWMVLAGHGARDEKGLAHIDMRPGHDESELRNHRDVYYGAIESDCSEDRTEICFFSRNTNWEIGRF